jgi:hypothetical protein
VLRSPLLYIKLLTTVLIVQQNSHHLSFFPACDVLGMQYVGCDVVGVTNVLWSCVEQAMRQRLCLGSYSVGLGEIYFPETGY